jgi:hypothetical protein
MQMKNKLQILGAGLLALLLTLAGCMNPLSEKPEAASPEASSGGTIVVRLAGLDARTLGPSVAEELAALQYRLVIVAPVVGDGAPTVKFIDEDIANSGGSYSLDAGSWIVQVWALRDDVYVANGTSAVTLAVGETENVVIALQPWTQEEAFGFFDYSIVFPEPTEDFGYTTATLTLDPTGPNTYEDDGVVAINLLDQKVSDPPQQLPAGKYILNIVLTSNREVGDKPLQAIVKEIVYIYPGLTTTTPAYVFTEADFSADVYLKGTALVKNFTTRDANGAPVHSYIPTRVEIEALESDPETPEETEIITAEVTWDAEKGEYTWELPLIASERLGAGIVNSVDLALVVASDEGHELIVPKPDISISRQGNSNIQLETSVYSIVKANNPYFAGIEGVEGIAHNSDAIAGTEVKLRIKPADNYGLIGTSVFVDTINKKLNSDGTIAFTMPPSAPPVVSANFFHLVGTASIVGDVYTPRLVEAYGQIPDPDNENEFVWKRIGPAENSINTTTSKWEILFTDGFIAFTDIIAFKVTSTAVGEKAQEWIGTKNINELIGDGLNLYVASLSKINNLRATSVGNSVTISWDPAAWATGYRIWWWDAGHNYSETTINTTTNINLSTGAYVYVNVSGQKDDYDIGIQNSVQVYIPNAPQNVSATKSDTAIEVMWNHVYDATGYYIYRSDGSRYVEIAYQASAKGETYIDDFELEPNTYYAYKIVAVKSDNLTYHVTSNESNQSLPVLFTE